MASRRTDASRILPFPERCAFAGRIRFPPARLAHGDVSAAREQPAPVAQPGFETQVVDGALGPDQVEGAVREIEPPHVGHAGLQPVREPEPFGFAVQEVDERRVVVDGDDARRRVARQHQRLAAGPAADVENASLGPYAGHEGEGPECARGIARALPGQPAEQFEEQRGRRVFRHRLVRRSDVRCSEGGVRRRSARHRNR